MPITRSVVISVLAVLSAAGCESSKEGATCATTMTCGAGLVCDAVQKVCVSSDPAIRYCSGDGWCWQSPSPQGNPLRAAWVVDTSNIWTVGDAGTILKWDGKRWLRQQSGTSVKLTGIWGPSATQLWAVGDGGTIV